MNDTIVVRDMGRGPHAISRDLWGVFFEDISYAADGGLASEMVQNGAFEYCRADSPSWSTFTAWRRISPSTGSAAFGVRTEDCVARENPHYVVVEVPDGAPEGSVALENTGFDGMVLHSGETYHFSVWARSPHGDAPLDVSLIGDDGRILASSRVTVPASGWDELHADLHIDVDPAGMDRTVSADRFGRGPLVAHRGSLRLTFPSSGIYHVDFVSMEPSATYRGLRHFRPDLVEALADLHPRFMRFPGGCITHGLGMDNMYHWTDTIAPVEHRPHNFNLWGYHQSFRLGYFEYLCLCETIEATPLPVLPAGVTCQNTAQGPIAIPEQDMGDYVSEVLALVEFCNGDPQTTMWGAERAALGHPKPFDLKYLGIGNEDQIDGAFRTRFRIIYDAVRDRYPEITVVGTVGPAPSGPDYDNGWAFARELGVPIVDEHSYQSSSWWFHNLDHYDATDRQGPKVYLGEYGSWGSMLISALSEAAFMSRMELNADVVSMASYAPLFARNGHHSWDPDLIYFDGEKVYHPYSYWVQRMFGCTAADGALPLSVEGRTTLHRDLPDVVRVAVDGGAWADLDDVSVECASGIVSGGGVSHRGTGVSDLGVEVHAESYVLRATVTYRRGPGDVRILVGDVTGRNHGVVGLGRHHSVQVVRDGTGYELGGSAWVPDDPRPGTVWHIRLEVSQSGGAMRLWVDDVLVADGREDPEEPRRVVTAALDSSAGLCRIRIVNALPEGVDVDMGDVLDAVGADFEDRRTASAVVLAGDDPYAGAPGEESATLPVESAVDVSDGTYHAPAWSFSVLTVRAALAMPTALAIQPAGGTDDDE